MRCANAGSDYDDENVQWTCKASLPPEFMLGSTEVICEGYDSPKDPFILKGSCGVEYRLVLTESGEEKYGKTRSWWGDSKTRSQPKKPDAEKPAEEEETLLGKVFAFLFWSVFIVAIVWALAANCRGAQRRANAPRQPRQPRTRRANWGGGDGGGGGDDPPPYDWSPPHPKPPPSTSEQERWRPGFWSGAATGAAAGYAAGNIGADRAARRQQREQERMQQNTGWGSWLGGDGGSAGPSGSHTGSSGSSSPPSTERYESTGFGSTSRR